MAALILGLAYTYSQDNRGKRVSFYFITFNVIWLPWAMLGLNFLMSGPAAALYQGTGLLAAHAYDFLTRLYPTFGGGRNIVQTPGFVKRWFGGNRPGITVKSYGTAYRQQPAAQPARGPTVGGSLGFRSSWGQGRRLGGD
jgi:Derlin-2/3